MTQLADESLMRNSRLMLLNYVPKKYALITRRKRSDFTVEKSD